MQLAKPPVLLKPLDGEELGIYLAVTEHAVSVVLIREENNIQHSVYYISKRLNEAEGRYPLIEKLTYCLILATRKLWPYFQAHPVREYPDQPLRKVLQKPDAFGQFLKWAVELGQYEVIFQPRTTIKGQALAHFVAECTDGSATDQLSDARISLVTPGGQYVHAADKFGFKASNNEAEYEALITGLRLAQELQVEHIEFCRNWPEELPEVLWSYRTTEKAATGQTPFAIPYGYEAMFPVELEPPSHKRLTYNQEVNHALLVESLDEVEEKRIAANLKLIAHQQKVARYFNKQVRAQKFFVGDMVLRRVFLNTKDSMAGVLGPNWEGPYQVIEVLELGAYKLGKYDEKRQLVLVTRYWNREHLRKYYE
ncbi:hypothetical protein CsatB_007552 [Cannabis sativa]